MKETKVKNIFDWLNQITLTKLPTSSFTEDDWKCFDSFMIHKYLSMNPEYIELVMVAQKIPYDQKKHIYSIYRDFIPKKKVWLKYIGSKKSKNENDSIEYISKYFECSLKEAEEYIEILGEDGTRFYLDKIGINKEVKKPKKIKKK